MVQAEMTHQAVEDHFNVSRITISRLTIRLRQTGRTNDRPRNDRPHVTPFLRLIHLRNRMVTAEDTVRRTPGLANVRISGQTVRRRLRESGLRARHVLRTSVCTSPTILEADVLTSRLEFVMMVARSSKLFHEH